MLLAELVLIGGSWVISDQSATIAARRRRRRPMSTTPRRIGRLIYTKYVYLFQGAGMVLLVAMVGAIVLTPADREGVKRQKIAPPRSTAVRRRTRSEGRESPNGERGI